MIPTCLNCKRIIAPRPKDDRCQECGSPVVELVGVADSLQRLMWWGLINNPKPNHEAAAAHRLVLRIWDSAGTWFGPPSLFLSWLVRKLRGVSFDQTYAPLLRRARQFTAEGAVARLRRDRRPPVVYLRPFAADHRFVWGVKSREELMAEDVDKIGPFVAIGRPDERIPDLGAGRLYVADEAWQQVVRMLVDESQLVILQAGGSDGVRWELNELISRRNRRKLVLYFDFRDRKHHEEFRKAANEMLASNSLPVQIAKLGWRSGFVYFDGDWNPHFEKNLKTVIAQVVPDWDRMKLAFIRDYQNS
jgi:hypothetical protein